ncbi:hypothetical protein B0T16DRAFT_486516 [Cercophora newfieldiana]|uniref:Thioredoxin domain-containing protein n=1 Tax=Cercophora newfieldiana TaxID=92897 RepID=A0AA39YPD1_9PEZI|nr:hypothetical protein B0T16DRAFT_486516 [Cercophora newfieldiana]
MRALSLWPLLVGHGFAWKHVSEEVLRAALKDNEYTLVAFVLPETEASKELEPEWTEVQKRSKDESIFSLDCLANPDVCQEFDVASYPAIRLYHRDGEMTRYRGERKADLMLSFSKRARKQAPLEADASIVPSLLDDDEIIFLAHIAPGDEAYRDQFKALATKYRDSYTFIVTGPMNGQSALHCFNNINEEEHTTEPLAKIGGLEAFIKRCSGPLIPELTRANEAEYTQARKSLLHFFFSSKSERDKCRAAFKPLAKKYAEFLVFVLNDVNEYPEMLGILGLKDGSETGLSLQNPNTGDVFPFRGSRKITPQVVEQFLNDVIDGNVKAMDNKSKGGHDEL